MRAEPIVQLVIDDSTAIPPFRTEERIYTPPAPAKSKRQAAALEAALRRRARWENQG